MSTANEKRALNGEEVWIEGEQVTGRSCVVVDSQGKEVASFVKEGRASLKDEWPSRCISVASHHVH